MSVVATGDRFIVEVLGPLRVRDAAGQDVTPDGALQRRLLALLVLHRGRAVSVDGAIDALWPGRPPLDPAAALQNHVFRLRRALPEGSIELVGGGYRLDPARLEVDADQLAAALHADAPDPRALEAILERWRGPAYPELDDVADARAEIERLNDLRVRATEVLAEHRLAAGATDGLVAELAALADAEPLRERPRSLLMSALVATGRHVEALRVFDDFRRQLGDELGIEPSPALIEQHAAVLGGAAPDGTAWSPSGRMPTPTTTLVGRDQQLAGILDVVQEHRVVTLVGPGGVGKTRLLLELGHQLRALHPEHAVVLCELAGAVDETAADMAAAALGIDSRPGVRPVDRIANVLADSSVILLLDNCEQILEPIAALVEELTARCAAVRVVVTSRERLRVPGERVWVVPTLDTDGGGSTAVELFVERARAVAPGFDPDEAQVETVAEVVRRLDGLPLAIELAAARLYTHDLDEVAAGLDHRFGLLDSGFRTSTRHGSLRAAVSWSFDQLEPPLQQIFVAVSVFVGPFTVDDAAAVVGAEGGDVAAGLSQLVERSLVMRAPNRRFVLLETLRAFGAEVLATSGQAEQVRERHARRQVDCAEAAYRRLLEPTDSLLGEVDAAVPELRSALGWLLANDQVALAGRLVASLIDFAFLRARLDVLVWSERVAAADPEDRSPAAAHVWVAAARAAWLGGDVGEARARTARALQICERTEVPVPAVVAMMAGNCALFEGDLGAAARWYRTAADAAADDPVQQAMARTTELLALGYAGDPSVPAFAESLLAEYGEDRSAYAAYIWYCAGEAVLSVDAELARSRLGRALEFADATNATIITGLAGASKASIDARLGDPASAAADYRRLIDHWRRAGVWSTQWTMLRSIAGLLARMGRHRDAAVLEGAVRATTEGHRIFGADELALAQLSTELRNALGDDAYEAARREGAVLDGDRAVEHALRAL